MPADGEVLVAGRGVMPRARGGSAGTCEERGGDGQGYKETCHKADARSRGGRCHRFQGEMGRKDYAYHRANSTCVVLNARSAA